MASFHDGVKLPRAYRAAGFMTDFCDATDLATCRMYRSAGQVWRGLAKNAREGMAGPVGVWVWTGLLFGGQVLPIALVFVDSVFTANGRRRHRPDLLSGAGVRCEACSFDLDVRTVNGRLPASSTSSGLTPLAVTNRHWLSALLHPLGVLLLLAVQWYAVVKHWLGRPVGWKDRPKPA